MPIGKRLKQPFFDAERVLRETCLDDHVGQPEEVASATVDEEGKFLQAFKSAEYVDTGAIESGSKNPRLICEGRGLHERRVSP
jgi:hypothetical protein